MSNSLPEHLADLDFASISPQEFAHMVAGATPADISALMQGETRERVIAEIFTRMEHQFRPEAAHSVHSVNATIHWTVTGERDISYRVTIAEGRCTTEPGHAEEKPTLALTMDDAAFLRLVSGNGSPIAMFMARELTASGDLALGTNLPRLFDIPRA
ncbi:SCP2 sterol-binding domain-containing protein [Lipingzhangella sp. LS1_29]|uniref:SCP2 sterol-binding domain-containing protein n=1 Tax=Lipingzhangella rawalii TaxID=2055835 RepID=A0ABU2H6U3_9ACTN|nr:SCP2 sterol-binding domain-containing protein [Lipingzhangella rawalii]MDS1271027.1 SCP2 sterol-binding domain-containing protein [Lipingzhangella rawalii]